MNIFDKKYAIYKQMALLRTERRELTKIYFELKERLIKLDDIGEELEKKILWLYRNLITNFLRKLNSKNI